MQPTTFDNLIQAIDGRAVRLSADSVFTRIQTDSRNVKPGDLFWPLRGHRFDGHQFVDEAFENGAIASLVSHEHASHAREQLNIVTVPDTTRALQAFAHWHRSRWGGPVIGVTGSCGKTTTRETIYSVLSTKLQGCQNYSNNNNHFGVPFTLLDIQPDHQFAVVECGASGFGEMHELVTCCRPDIGIITGVSNAHLDGFQNLQGVYAEKTKMVRMLSSDGLAILPGDNRKLRELAQELPCRTILVGEGPANDVRIQDVRLVNGQVQFELDRDIFEIPLAGKHHAHAGAIAVALGREFGLGVPEIKGGLQRIRPIPGRCQVTHVGSWTIINDTYNANPTSTQAACQLLRDYNAPFPARKHLVLGNMLELGGRSVALHQKLGRQIAVSEIDELYTLGSDAENIIAGAVEEGFPSTQTIASNTLMELCEQLVSNLHHGDVVLIKGSRGMRMERVIDYLRDQARTLPTNLARAA